MRLLIKNVNVFDGKNSKIKEVCSIVIENNIVEAIEHSEISEENFDKVIDGKGGYAIPGLTDAHVHLGKTYMAGNSLDYDIAVSAKVAEKLLDHGITTVRDAGGITEGLKKAIDEGVINGPRIFPSGAYISQTCGHGDSENAHAVRDIQYRIPVHSVLADGPDEVRRAVREQFYRGASQIKLMAGGGLSSRFDPVSTLQFSSEEMKTAVETAADYGTYVMAHLYTPGCMQRAIKAGVKSLEHGHAMDEETAKMIKEFDVFLAPLPQFTQKELEWNHIVIPKNPNPRRKNPADEIVSRIEQTTELIVKYDLKILFGTDMMITYPQYEPRASLDIAEYKKRFGSFKGLLAATGNFNDIVKLTTYQNPYPDGEVGVLAEGSYADILIVNGNPAADLDILSDTENLLLIMKDGKIHKNKLA